MKQDTLNFVRCRPTIRLYTHTSNLVRKSCSQNYRVFVPSYNFVRLWSADCNTTILCWPSSVGSQGDATRICCAERMCACNTAVRPQLSIDISKTSTRMVNGKGKWSIRKTPAILHLPLPFTMRVEVLEISIDSSGRTAVLQAHMVLSSKPAARRCYCRSMG